MHWVKLCRLGAESLFFIDLGTGVVVFGGGFFVTVFYAKLEIGSLFNSTHLKSLLLFIGESK